MALFRIFGCILAIAIGVQAALTFYVEIGVFFGLTMMLFMLMFSCCLPSNDPKSRAAMIEMREAFRMRRDLLDYYSKEEARRLDVLREESLSCSFRNDYRDRMAEIFRWRKENHRRISKMDNKEVRREYTRIIGTSEF